MGLLQVQEMQEQLSALTSGFEHLSLEQLDAFSIQRSPHGRLTSTPARRWVQVVNASHFDPLVWTQPNPGT
jgi:hypothetical protein